MSVVCSGLGLQHKDVDLLEWVKRRVVKITREELLQPFFIKRCCASAWRRLVVAFCLKEV